MGAVHYRKAGFTNSTLPDLRVLPFGLRPTAENEQRSGFPPKRDEVVPIGMLDRTPIIDSRRFHS